MLIAAPGLFSKPSGDLEKDVTQTTKLRGIGGLLLVVAGMYLLVKITSAR